MSSISCAESSGEQAVTQYNNSSEKVDASEGPAAQERLINKADKAKDAIVEIGQAYSKPLLIFL
jgi:hypothetical protein